MGEQPEKVQEPSVDSPPDESQRDEKRETSPRRGDVAKCPVCGSAMDSEAFHCPTCHSFFCYQCRARLLPSDKQLECINQSCDYYGKLTCSICNAPVERSEPPAVYLEPEGGYWPALLLLTLLFLVIVWAWTSFAWGLLFAILLYCVGGYLLHSLGVNIFGRERRVEHQRKSRVYLCLCCQEPVKELKLDSSL